MDLKSYLLGKASMSGEGSNTLTAQVTQTSDGATITITDKNGTTTATVVNGKDGADGAKGEKGEKGEQGIQGPVGPAGADGKDGYTPIKGVDYFDGEQGPQGEKGETGVTGPQGEQGPKGDKGDTGATGKDGTSVTVVTVTESTVDGGSNVVSFSDGKTLTVKNGSKGDKGDKGDTGSQGEQGLQGVQGEKGADGISVTHTWNGTTLTVTSASGTSSADLKGEKGDKGDKGEQGVQGLQGEKGIDGKNGTDGKDGVNGKDGYTPIKGVDYFDGADGKDGATGSAGVGIKSVVQTTTSSADGGSNVITVTKTDNTTSTFTVKNGSKGSTGAKGDDGYTPVKGVDYFDGKDGKDGVSGVYVGSGEMPEGYNVQIDPEGIVITIDDIIDTIAPAYITSEAKEVADKVIENRTPNSLVLLMASDIHEIASVPENHSEHKKATADLGLAMAEVRKYIKADAVALMGDYVYNVEPLSKELAMEAMKEVIRKLSSATNGVTSLWLDGNHDYYECDAENKDYRLTDNEHYALVGANNTSNAVVDLDNIARNYGYVDFEKQRIRLIYLNTTDISGGVYSSNYITDIQGKWLINTLLDMNSKDDADKWGVVVCSHFPIYSAPFTTLKAVISAFKDKSSGTHYGTSYDFKDVTSEFIATFHGHIHNFKVTDVTTTKGNIIKAICIPNACINRENPYTGDFQEVDSSGAAISYPKTTGTAESTSFNAVVIDRDSKTISAICYGAGYDRTIAYGEVETPPEVIIVNQIPISTDTTGAIYNGTGYKDGVRLGSDGTDRTGAATDATGFIPCVNGDKLYFKNCEIKVGTGIEYNEIAYYSADKAYIAKSYIYQESALTQSTVTMDSNNNLVAFDTSEITKDFAFVRVTGNYIGADSIITVNQEVD